MRINLEQFSVAMKGFESKIDELCSMSVQMFQRRIRPIYGLS